MGIEALFRVDLSAASALAIAVSVVPAVASCTRADVRGERGVPARGATTESRVATLDGIGDATGPMLPVPAGAFAMGSLDGDDDERPVHVVSVAAFTIGATEVTARGYGACVAAAACPPAGDGPYCTGAVPARADHPINCVAWSDAKAFCAWVGGRLPTEAQWEYAARGPSARTYPWGDAPPRAQLCWDGPGSELGLGKRRGTCPVGRYPDGRGPFGALDMAGNVWEWTADAYSEDYGAEALSAAATAIAGARALRVVRGGTWFGYDADDVRAALRFRVRPEARNYGIGFRCVSDH